MPSTNVVGTRHSRMIKRGVPPALAFQETETPGVRFGHPCQCPPIPGSGLVVCRQNRRTGGTFEWPDTRYWGIGSNSHTLDKQYCTQHDEVNWVHRLFLPIQCTGQPVSWSLHDSLRTCYRATSVPAKNYFSSRCYEGLYFAPARTESAPSPEKHANLAVHPANQSCNSHG